MREMAVADRDRSLPTVGSPPAEQAIFDATERLLARTTIHQLTVADILGEASVSRTTFYAYFASKTGVVTALLGRVADEAFESGVPFSSAIPTRAQRRCFTAP